MAVKYHGGCALLQQQRGRQQATSRELGAIPCSCISCNSQLPLSGTRDFAVCLVTPRSWAWVWATQGEGEGKVAHVPREV